MRRLLLLLLTFLLPLQLLAAPVGELSPSVSSAQVCEVGASAAASFLHGLDDQAQASLSKLIGADAGSQSPVDDDQGKDDPAKQAECEDHAMPALVVTPSLSWQPFPHAFTAPPGGASFVRDQLHPPPLG